MACDLWRLSPDLLVGVATFKAEPGEPLEATVLEGNRSLPAMMRWMSTPGLAAGQLNVLTISVPDSRGGQTRRTLEIRRKDGERILGPVALLARDIKEKSLPEALKTLDSAEREEVVRFISSAPTTHPCKRDDFALSKSLFAVRQALREELTSLIPDRDRPQGGSVELLMRIDDTAFYVQGWLLDREAPLKRVTAIAPEGERVELLEGLVRYSRPDVEEFYGPNSDGSVLKPGFLAYFETDSPSSVPEGWVVEVENEMGRSGQIPAPPVPRKVNVAQMILSYLPVHSLPDDELMSRHVSRAVTRQQECYRRLGNAVEIVEYGHRPRSPEVSIVVPLYKRIDFLQHQLAQFALDPEVRASELIYVLDSPELERELRETAAQLHPLYGVPFVVATQERSSGFAGATNIGTREARGKLLLLLNSDILPDKPGWLGAMSAFYESKPSIGALGPKLLYEDDSLQHAGMYFHLPADTALAGIWANVHYFKGLDRDLPAANVARPVPAVTGACMMVGRELYEEVGGFPEVYVQGDHEDSDLCLRLIDAGYENWYVPEVELYHLEAQSYPDPLRGRMALYNRWLHAKRWDRLIHTVMGRYPADDVENAAGDLVGVGSEAPVPTAANAVAERKPVRRARGRTGRALPPSM